ncbi:MAG: tetraacyldisaccharide 4'-kinase [Phycisphaerae bacterium]|nr:tetraacyldisaccharide 4'-kinase [Phycisphaerae bacterium]
MVRPETLDILSKRRRGPMALVTRTLLHAPALAYAAAMRARRRLYRWGVLPSRRAPLPVICVGNLTTGGTGKTPMVAWVAARLREAGHRPAVLIRGYKPVAGRSDEAELLAELTGAPVVTNADRLAGAAEAARRGADVAVMDDGFQHRRLRRDMDIVLIDAMNPFGYGHCLPRGLLREPASALIDADAVVITRSNALDADALGALKTRLSRLAPAATIHAAVHRPTAVIDGNGAERPAHAIEGKRVLAFCGLGNPDGFFDTVERMGATVVARRRFADHAAYPPRRLAALRAAADAAGAELLVTTAKDAVKLPHGATDAEAAPIWRVVVEMHLVEGARALSEAIAGALRGDSAQVP